MYLTLRQRKKDPLHHIPVRRKAARITEDKEGYFSPSFQQTREKRRPQRSPRKAPAQSADEKREVPLQDRPETEGYHIS